MTQTESTDWPDSDASFSSISTLTSLSEFEVSDNSGSSDSDYDVEPLNERIATAKATYYRLLAEHTADPENTIEPSVNKTACDHNLSESTLRRYLKNPHHMTQAEQHTSMQLLSPQEERAIADRAKFMDDWNCAPDKEVLEGLACILLKKRGVENPVIGRHWMYRFLERNTDVAFVFNQPLERNRANAEDFMVMKNHFTKLKYVRDKYQIKKKNIWNLDEKGFVQGKGKKRKRICKAGRRCRHFKENGSRTFCTVVESVSSKGKKCTPLIIFKGVQHTASWYRTQKEEEYWYGYQKKGYMNSIICLKYLEKVFEPESAVIAGGDWRLLIYDGYDAHLDPAVVEFCWDHHIIPYCLPAHTSHIAQPLDVGVFSSLQNFYGKEVNKLQARAINNNNFPNLLARARRKALTKDNIKAGFRASGIVPLRPHIILDTLEQPNSPQPEHQFKPSPELDNIQYSSLEPSNKLSVPRPKTPDELEAHNDAIWTCQTPTTPNGISALHQEALKTIFSASPHSIKQRTIMLKQYHVARSLWAELEMARAGEKHLREGEKSEQVKQDRRKLNSGSAVIVEKESVLMAEKLARDLEDSRESQEKSYKRQKKSLPTAPKIHQSIGDPVYTPYIMRF